MNATIKIENKLSLTEIMVKDESIAKILKNIHSDILECVQDISLERQKETPNYEDIDSPLHRALNKIESLGVAS